MRTISAVVAPLLLATAGTAAAQVTVDLVPADPMVVPYVVDSNSPSFWRDGRLYIFSWGGMPAPEIGALVSSDGGHSFTGLGIVLRSGEPINCAAPNGFFAGGNGGFSVIPDREQRYFYFLFGAYGGDTSSQGVAMARMSFDSRRNPVGAVWKYYQGAWFEPGLGGRVTPVFPATVGGRVRMEGLRGGEVRGTATAAGYRPMEIGGACPRSVEQRTATLEPSGQ